jgi:hypothetical protein
MYQITELKMPIVSLTKSKHQIRLERKPELYMSFEFLLTEYCWNSFALSGRSCQPYVVEATAKQTDNDIGGLAYLSKDSEEKIEISSK